MPPRRNHACVSLEHLESRHLPATLPVNTLAVVDGVVPSPAAQSQVSAPVTPRNINGRHSIQVGISITPPAGSALEPRLVAAYGPSGERLLIIRGAPFVRGVHESVTAFIQVGQPGPIRIVVAGEHGTTGSFEVREYLPGDIDGDGQVSVADLNALVPIYLASAGQPFYDLAADANLNGQVGFGDALFIERNMAPRIGHLPLFASLHLAPGQQARTPHSSNSGGVTALQHVTIEGQTVPGALVLFDSGLGDYTFTGGVVPTDAQGRFHKSVTLKEGLNNFNFLIHDAYGRQIIRDFPIFWTTFAEPGSPIK